MICLNTTTPSTSFTASASPVTDGTSQKDAPEVGYLTRLNVIGTPSVVAALSSRKKAIASCCSVGESAAHSSSENGKPCGITARAVVGAAGGEGTMGTSWVGGKTGAWRGG